LEAALFGEVAVKEVLVLLLKPDFGSMRRYDKECLWSIHQARGG
jgi:hypothetical protein